MCSRARSRIDSEFRMEPWAPNTPEQFGEIIRNDVARWAGVVKATNLKVE